MTAHTGGCNDSTCVAHQSYIVAGKAAASFCCSWQLHSYTVGSMQVSLSIVPGQRTASTAYRLQSIQLASRCHTVMLL